MVNIGAQAPDFELLNQDGKPVRLSDFRGRKVVLFFFPSAQEYSWGCTAQACAFRDEFDDIRDENAAVIGISHDKPKDLKSWSSKRRLPYDLLSDPGFKVHDQWGARMQILGISLPRTNRAYFVVDENGVIIDGQTGIMVPQSSARNALEAVRRMNNTARA